MVGAVARVVWVAAHVPGDHVYSDMQGYVDRAVKIATGAPLERYDAFYPPGTHLLLAVPLKLFGTGRGGLAAGAAVWCALSIAFVPLAWWLARRWSNAGAAAVVAVVLAVWPIHLGYTGFFLSEVPAWTALAAALVAAELARDSPTAGRLVGAGLAAGVVLTIRPQLALNVALAGAVLVVGVGSHRRRIVPFVVAAAIPVAAVVALNTAAAGRPTGLSENGAFNFFQAQCDARWVRTGNARIGRLDFVNPVALELGRGTDYRIPNTLAYDQAFFFRHAVDCVADDGVGQLRLVARSFADATVTTPPWPMNSERPLRTFVQGANLLYCALAPIGVAGALWAVRRHRRQWRTRGIVLGHLALVVPTIVVFGGDPRFRAPYDMFGIVLVAATAVDLASRRRARQPSTSDAMVSGGTNAT